MAGWLFSPPEEQGFPRNGYANFLVAAAIGLFSATTEFVGNFTDATGGQEPCKSFRLAENLAPILQRHETTHPTRILSFRRRQRKPSSSRKQFFGSWRPSSEAAGP